MYVEVVNAIRELEFTVLAFEKRGQWILGSDVVSTPVEIGFDKMHGQIYTAKARLHCFSLK